MLLPSYHYLPTFLLLQGWRWKPQKPTPPRRGVGRVPQQAKAAQQRGTQDMGHADQAAAELDQHQEDPRGVWWSPRTLVRGVCDYVVYMCVCVVRGMASCVCCKVCVYICYVMLCIIIWLISCLSFCCCL
jgi:hypothetical protein